ncbi:MAG: pyridoxal phosphate-dependent aminotransferase [Terriglobales bacterium]
MSVGTQVKTSLTERINRIETSATLAVVNEADRMRLAGADLVDFGAGEPHFNTPQHIKDAAIAAIQANFTKYTPVGGTAELRDALVKRHAQDFGSDYKREECIASTGDKHALFNAIQVLVEHHDEVIVPVPGWVSFKDIIRYAGGNPVFVETDESKGFSLSPAMIESAITPRTKAIIINSPSNPTGAVLPQEDFKAIVRMAAERGIWVICDECYVYLDYSGRRFSGGEVTEAKERIVVIGSLSKTYAMTGWRLGYALAPKEVVSAMQKLQSQSTSNPTSIVQKAAVGAVTGPQDCIKEMVEEYIRLRDRMVNGLTAIPGVKCNVPKGAFYAYPNVSAFFGRKGINSASDVAGRLLREAEVVTVPGEAFGTTQHIRISYPTSPREIDRGLERIRKFFGTVAGS